MAEPVDPPRASVAIRQAIRKTPGMSTRALAKQAGVSQSHLVNVTSGRHPATPQFLRKIALALRITPWQFAEYRLAMARERFDPARNDLDDALADLDTALPCADLNDPHERRSRELKEACEICGLSPQEQIPDCPKATRLLELHRVHVLDMTAAATVRTLCPNCHRVAHMVGDASERSWPV